jgi:hypothetical protein
MSFTTPEHDAKIAKLTFASVYPHYVTKVIRKGRTEEELLLVIEWLTSYNKAELVALIESKATFVEFFENAKMHPNAHLIKGLICGYRVEDISNKLTQQVRYLDKIVDELANGKTLEKIMRS